MKIKKFGYQMIPLLFLAGGLLTGCVPAPVEPPTPLPQLTATMAPTQSELPSLSASTATPTTIPSVLDLVSGPLAEAVYVAAPGPNSQVALPLVVEGVVDTALGSEVTVQLMAFDPFGKTTLDRLLAEETFQILPEVGTLGAFRVTMDFFPQENESVGWVSVMVLDPETGGLAHMNTIPLTLLKNGQAEIALPETTAEAISIDAPQNGQVVAGGEFSLSGRTMISSASVLAVYLCRTGVEIGEAPTHPYCGSVFHILEKGQVEVLPGQAGEAGTFLQPIPYFVEKATPARLVVIASGEKGYALHVSSVEILLQP